MKNSNDTIGNRTRDLPACTIIIIIIIIIIINISLYYDLCLFSNIFIFCQAPINLRP